MKHKALIQAALDGKEIQYRKFGGSWCTFGKDVRFAVANMAAEYPSFEYRIKPESVPDRVAYTGAFVDWTPNDLEKWLNWCRAQKVLPIKITIKTDENGVETQHVEIVK